MFTDDMELPPEELEPEFPRLFIEELEKRIPGIKITKQYFWGNYNINIGNKTPLCLAFHDDHLILSTSTIIEDTRLDGQAYSDEHTWKEKFEYSNPSDFDIDKIVNLIKLWV